MAGTESFTINQRDAMKHATVTVTVHQPIHHRVLWAIGMDFMRLGAWLMGLAGVTEEHEGGQR